MSARNGDKSRFSRERKQKIARRKRNQGLLQRAAKARERADATVGAQATVGVGMNTPLLSLAVSARIPDAVKKEACVANRHIACEAGFTC
jgi:hypothetical protein